LPGNNAKNKSFFFLQTVYEYFTGKAIKTLMHGFIVDIDERKNYRRSIFFKVILPADSSWSGLLSLLQSLKIKIFTKYQPQNVYGSEENRMFITFISKNSLYFWL
jgi:hypothetical protein